MSGLHTNLAYFTTNIPILNTLINLFTQIVAFAGLLAAASAGYHGHAVSSQSIVRHDEGHYAAPVHYAAPAHYAAPLVHAAPVAHYAAPVAHYAAPAAYHGHEEYVCSFNNITFHIQRRNLFQRFFPHNIFFLIETKIYLP